MPAIKQSPVAAALAAFRADMKIAPKTLRAHIDEVNKVDCETLYKLDDLEPVDVKYDADGSRVSDGSVPIIARAQNAAVPHIRTTAQWKNLQGTYAGMTVGVASPTLVFAGHGVAAVTAGGHPEFADFYIVGLKTEAEIRARVNLAAAAIAKNCGGEMTIFRELKRIVFLTPCGMAVRIWLAPSLSIGRLLRYESAGSYSCAFDGEAVYVNALGKLAHESMLNVVDLWRRYAGRFTLDLVESYMGGRFDLALPALSAATVPTESFRAPGRFDLKFIGMAVQKISKTSVLTAHIIYMHEPHHMYQYNVKKLPQIEIENMEYCAALKPHRYTATAGFHPAVDVTAIPVTLTESHIRAKISQLADKNAINYVGLETLVRGTFARAIVGDVINGRNPTPNIDCAIAYARKQLAIPFTGYNGRYEFDVIPDITSEQWHSRAAQSV